MIVKDVGGHFLIVFISRARQSSFKGRMCAEGIKCALGLSMDTKKAGYKSCYWFSDI